MKLASLLLNHKICSKCKGRPSSNKCCKCECSNSACNKFEIDEASKNICSTCYEMTTSTKKVLQYLESNLALALSRRVVEEIIFDKNNVKTGAFNDFQRVASIARSTGKSNTLSIFNSLTKNSETMGIL